MKKPRTPYLGPKRRQVSWPPQQRDVNEPGPDGFTVRQDGEPVAYQLERWANDRAASVSRQVRCCDCGLTHFVTQQVIEQDGAWWIIERSWRLDGPKKPKG